MVRLLALVSSGLLFAAFARAELLLTPRILEVEKEGGKVRQFAFSDGDQTVIYQAPRGWDYSGSSTQLTLRPPNKNQAQATITRIPLGQPGSFDEESLKKLVSEATAQVPKGAENIIIVSQEKNLMMIKGKDTFLITLSYTFYGQLFGRSIFYLNRGNEQIRSQLTCSEADFKELHRAFFASQGSWRNL